MIRPDKSPHSIMSQLDRESLDNRFGTWKKARLPDATDSVAFEVFTAELILKDADLSDSEIESGIAGGGGDGGVDGFFFFIDRALVLSDAFVPRASQNAQLDIIQSTLTAGFDEAKIDKLGNFCRYLLDWQDLSEKKSTPNRKRTHDAFPHKIYRTASTFSRDGCESALRFQKRPSAIFKCRIARGRIGKIYQKQTAHRRS